MSIIEGILNLNDLGEAKKLLEDYRVLDASCGSGNFLFIAYRELKRIERMIHDREILPIHNLHGIDERSFFNRNYIAEPLYYKGF